MPSIVHTLLMMMHERMQEMILQLQAQSWFDRVRHLQRQIEQDHLTWRHLLSQELMVGR